MLDSKKFLSDLQAHLKAIFNIFNLTNFNLILIFNLIYLIKSNLIYIHCCWLTARYSFEGLIDFEFSFIYVFFLPSSNACFLFALFNESLEKLFFSLDIVFLSKHVWFNFMKTCLKIISQVKSNINFYYYLDFFCSRVSIFVFFSLLNFARFFRDSAVVQHIDCRLGWHQPIVELVYRKPENDLAN